MNIYRRTHDDKYLRNTELFVSFCTPTYRETADRLIDSFAGHDLLNLVIYDMPQSHGWVEQIRHGKLAAMRQARRDQPHASLIWIDADAELLRSPYDILHPWSPRRTFIPIVDDIAVRYRKGEMLAGVIGFNKDTVDTTLDVWESYMESMEGQWDLKCLQAAVDDGKLSTMKLDRRFEQLLNEGPEENFDIPRQSFRDTVFLHHQMSRHLKGEVNELVRP